MSPTVEILMLLLGFGATHMGLSSLRLRGALVSRIGETPFTLLYSVVALAFFIPLVWVYFAHKHAGELLWMMPRGPWMLWTMYLGMGLAFILMVAGLARPSPASLMGGDPTPAGVYRITRHPVMMAIAIFGLVHLLPNGSTADVAFFGGLTVFALAGAWHQDRRKLRMDLPGFRHFYEGTPFIPFTGPQPVLGIRALFPTIIGIGIVLTIVVRYLHSYWTG